MHKIGRIPYKIGITGTIGSGKSLVGSILQSAGVPVLDTDSLVEELYHTDIPLKQEIVARFGPPILDSKGNVNKNALRAIVFQNATELKALERLVHPCVSKRVRAFFEDWKSDSPIGAVQVPLLFEAGMEKAYDEIWAVITKPDVLVERLMKRNNIRREEAIARMAKQWSQEKKADRATRTIENSGTPEETRSQVLEALGQIREALTK